MAGKQVKKYNPWRDWILIAGLGLIGLGISLYMTYGLLGFPMSFIYMIILGFVVFGFIFTFGFVRYKTFERNQNNTINDNK